MNSFKGGSICNACPERDGLAYFKIEKEKTDYIVRMLNPDDAVGLMGLYDSLDEESLYTRYCSYGKDPAKVAIEAVDLSSQESSLDLVVEDQLNSEIVAHAGLVRNDYNLKEAEYHCVVNPLLQGRRDGNSLHLGSRMFEETVKLAIANGILIMHSDVLVVNSRMNRILQKYNDLGHGITISTKADTQDGYTSFKQMIKRDMDPSNLLVPCFAANGLCRYIADCPQMQKETALQFAV